MSGAEAAVVGVEDMAMDHFEEALVVHTAVEGQNSTFAAGSAAFGKGAVHTNDAREQTEKRLKLASSIAGCGT